MSLTEELDEEAAALLTAKQRRALEIIEGWVARNGAMPTVRELGDCMGLRSTCSVQRYLEALARKGFLRKTSRYRARGWEPARTRAVCPPYVRRWIAQHPREAAALAQEALG